ncbi:uncharacterized protein LOC129244083 [Anastrepha obliqua]|uniref:uncharacterized protein LOC129244083 n=1 Tax=Anastrepha obliqua TaxID=95512 RepID=UPI00240A0C1D|nr:uncharacterized protein LOC129244083 [Anastrepha obliqua]
MEVIEFIEHTNLRNLKFNIKSMVQASLRRINEELEERRLMLRHMLESEHLTYSEELALLTKQRIEEAARKRHEWFGIQRMERELETEKFLKLKKLQREMESCEKARHLESKTLLLDSKRAQLYQIEEKEVMRQKEKQIKQMWLDVQRRFNEEMLEQDNLERKLLKVIAKSNQEMNSRNDECQKEINKINDKAARNEFAKEDASASLKDKLYMERLKEMEKNKALSQHNVLTVLWTMKTTSELKRT